jgi:hypothetical protein
VNPAARAGVVALLLLPLVLLVAAPSSATGSRTQAGHRASHVSRTLRLEVPTGLALAPDGDLFIADQWLEQIVERQPDGRFRVVAGTGRPGFRGDGGPATRAELDTPTALVRAADGTLYFIDQGNQRVRALLSDGKIVTVAGGGPLGASTIASGTPATEVSFSPSNLTIGPGGDLYVTAGDEVLRLSPSGLFTVMADASNFLDVVRTYQGSCGTDAIAFDRAGLLWVGCDNSRQPGPAARGRVQRGGQHLPPARLRRPGRRTGRLHDRGRR